MTYLWDAEVWVRQEEVEVLGDVTPMLGDFFLEESQHCSEDVVTDGDGGIQRRNHCNRYAATSIQQLRAPSLASPF